MNAEFGIMNSELRLSFNENVRFIPQLLVRILHLPMANFASVLQWAAPLPNYIRQEDARRVSSESTSCFHGAACISVPKRQGAVSAPKRKGNKAPRNTSLIIHPPYYIQKGDSP